METLDLPMNQNCKWYCEYLIYHHEQLSIDQINELMDTIIDKITLNECYYLWSIIMFVPVESIVQKSEDAIIQKDPDGEYCYWFAKHVPNINIEKLEDAVIQKDKDGYYCYQFAKCVPNANIDKLQDAIIDKDPAGLYCLWFARDVSKANVGKLMDIISQKIM